jgi:hypothetical protein
MEGVEESSLDSDRFGAVAQSIVPGAFVGNAADEQQ